MFARWPDEVVDRAFSALEAEVRRRDCQHRNTVPIHEMGKTPGELCLSCGSLLMMNETSTHAAQCRHLRTAPVLGVDLPDGRTVAFAHECLDCGAVWGQPDQE